MAYIYNKSVVQLPTTDKVITVDDLENYALLLKYYGEDVDTIEERYEILCETILLFEMIASIMGNLNDYK